MTEFNAEYWSTRWKNDETQWDVGYPTPPIKNYIDGLTNKNIRVLVPGAGNAYEGVYLLENGFHNTFILDISPLPLKNIQEKHPWINSKNLILGDFFELKSTYDLLLEQTFFCALHPSLRRRYVEKCHQLLVPNGILAGVLFNDTLNTDHPPFGGNLLEYQELFHPYFEGSMEPCYNSIKPRENRELFIKLTPKELNRG